MTPFLAPLFDFLPGTQTWRDSETQKQMELWKGETSVLAEKWGFDLGRAGRWEIGEKTDLITLLGTNKHAQRPDQGKVTQHAPITTQEEAATVILDLLAQTADPVLDEMRRAIQRPQSRFNVKYDYAPVSGILLPHLAAIKNIVLKLSWRADAELVLGKTNEAFADLLLGMQISDTIRNEPFLISHLVRIAGRAITTQVIWDGMAGHQWSDSQLQRLQAVLEKDNLTQDSQQSLILERNFLGVRSIEQVIAREGGVHLDDLVDGDRKVKPLHLVMPTGWLYLEMVNLVGGYETFLSRYEEWKSGKLDARSFLEVLNQAQDQVAKPRPLKALFEHRLMSQMLLPAVHKVHHKGILAQNRSNLAAGACALERYFLAHGGYPEQLEALVPKFIAKAPSDIMTGAPLIYRRESPGSYLLYSVGMNLADDGGKVVKTKGGGVNPDLGDWVWRQPGK
jgi:hypothetical protein